MQGLDNREAQTSKRANAPRDGLPPGLAAAIVLALIAIAGLIFFLTKSDAEPIEPPAQTLPTTEPNPATAPEPLTEAEAIATFKELDKLRLKMYEERDIALLPKVLAENSPLRGLARAEIRKLKNQHVLIRTRYVTTALEIRSIRPGRIVVLHTTRQFPKFVTEDGEDVTAKDSHPVRKEIRWVLETSGSATRIFDSKTISSRRLSK